MFQKILGVIFFLAFSTAAWAYDFYTGDIYYNITSSDNKTVEVTNKYPSGGTCYSGNVTIPETVTNEGIEYRVTAIGDWAFKDCYGLTSVTIPESVTAIDAAAFRNCYGLTSATIPESVTSIGYGTFSGCDGLKNLDGKFATADHRCLVINDTLKAVALSGLTQYTIPDGVKVIGNEAFESCSGLTSVTIGDGVTSIGTEAFSYCSDLMSVTIGESVTTIGRYAFYCCTDLTSVTAYNPTPVNIATAFSRVDCANCKLYVPKGSVEAYRNAAGWSEFGEILPINESSAITEIRQDNADGHITVYNLQGVPVLETDDAADLKTLQNGAYIVNGKTIIIAR